MGIVAGEELELGRFGELDRGADLRDLALGLTDGAGERIGGIAGEGRDLLEEGGERPAGGGGDLVEEVVQVGGRRGRVFLVGLERGLERGGRRPVVEGGDVVVDDVLEVGAEGLGDGNGRGELAARVAGEGREPVANLVAEPELLLGFGEGEKALALGARGFIVKPYTSAKIKYAIAKFQLGASL